MANSDARDSRLRFRKRVSCNARRQEQGAGQKALALLGSAMLSGTPVNSLLEAAWENTVKMEKQGSREETSCFQELDVRFERSLV